MSDPSHAALFEVLSEIGELVDPAEIKGLLERMLDVYGLKTVAYLGTGTASSRRREPYLAVTYSPDWVERYRSQRYVEIDPVVQVGMRRMLPTDWADLGSADRRVRNFFGEAAEFGLGHQGLSIPVHGQYGDRALFSITSDLCDRDWRTLRQHYMRDFQVLALHMHVVVLRLEGNATEPQSLSPRERECLQWIAEGKTVWECSIILGLSMHTVRCYLESVRHKLGATSNTHAVAKALKADLLTLFP